MTSHGTDVPLPLPITLQTAAARLGADFSKRLLYREYYAGRLRAWKIGGRLFTDEIAIQEWLKFCREKSSPITSTSAPDVPPAGSFEAAPERSAQDMALISARLRYSIDLSTLSTRMKEALAFAATKNLAARKKLKCPLSITLKALEKRGMIVQGTTGYNCGITGKGRRALDHTKRSFP